MQLAKTTQLMDHLDQALTREGEWLYKNDFRSVPFTAPEMPVPGPDFLELANNLITWKNADKNNYLEILYSLALYQNWFSMDVKVKNLSSLVRFIPGHRWAEKRATGPIGKCSVMVIGKMPTQEDAQVGRHFIGKVGDTLIEALQAAGCTGEDDYYDWYVTNLIKFGNPAPWLGSAIRPNWLKDCKPLLQMELRLVRPDYILCLGSEAGKELLGMQATVKNAVGHVFDYKIPLHTSSMDKPDYHNVKVMTCINPSAVVRTPDLQAQLYESIKMFVRLINGEDVGGVEKDIEHLVIKTEEELNSLTERVLKETENGGAIAVDCEWHGEHPQESNAFLRTIQISHKPKFAACLVIKEKGGKTGNLRQEHVLDCLQRIFLRDAPSCHIRPVGHFHRADLPWLLHYGLDLRKAFEAPSDPISGWELTKTRGGFDTGAAAHSCRETDDYKLEVLATRYTKVPRYDVKLQEAKKELCKQLKIKADDLEGYGDIPDEVLYPYANYDVCATRRLFDVYNGEADKPGLLDCDEYRNNSRMAFWISMRASSACAEMEHNGLLIDIERAEKLIDVYKTAKNDLLLRLRDRIKWTTFNPDSPFDCRELLFGVKYRGQVDKETNKPKRNSPPEAELLNLKPIKATGKVNKKSWEDLERYGEAHKFTPATDKETLGILFHTYDDVPSIKLLRDYRFTNQLLKTTLRPPSTNKDDGTDLLDENGNAVYEKGLLSYCCSDSRIRTTIYQTLETGRYSSSRPALQNISKRRESDYQSILGDKYLYPLRSIFVASPGHVLIEADYIGAELAIMAWLSGDRHMIDHVRRAQLPENHEDFYDIHSSVAVLAFKLNCAPTKKGLASIGKIQLRVAAKNVIFGYAYGRGAAAIARQAKEEGVTLSVEEAQALINGLIAAYPMLPFYFNACKARVNDPGWVCNPFGRFRRFHASTERGVQGEQERQAMNFNIQSTTADAVSRALDYLRELRGCLNYKILLQIHDAVLLEVPIEEIDEVYDNTLPKCMADLVDITPCDLDGIPVKGRETYHLGIDKEVMLRWGEKLTNVDEAKRLGIPLKYVKQKKG